MKKIQQLLLVALFSLIATNINAQASDLFFSEYAEGSSFNKYVEISNATGAEVDLSMYEIKKGTNGGDFSQSMTLSGMLPDGEVYVVSRDDADPQIVAEADEFNSSVINFNGDDVMGLFKNEVLIDIIGVVGDDPGDGWEVAGVADGTKEHTLVRKPNVCDPTTDWAAAAGTNADDSQWIVYDQNYWDDLGMHTSDCGGGQNVATPTFSPPAGEYFEAIEVEISCATPDATIYYTMDGTDPDDTSTPYTSPVAIDADITIKAIAYAPDLDPSNIAQADYTFGEYITVPDLTELRDSYTGGTEIFVVSGEVILTYQQDFRGQKYIQDDFAGVLIDDDGGAITTQYEIGDGITGITGTLLEYGNMLQFVPVVDPGQPTSNGNQVTPVEITIAEMTSNFEDYEARVVKISDVSFADQGSVFESGTVYPISDGSKAEGNFRTTFYDVDYIGTMIPAGAGEITGILNSRNDGDYISSRSLNDFLWTTVGEPSNYPTGFAASASGTTINLSWADATGEIPPTGYLIMASDQDNISLPEDGTPVFDDMDFSDGMGSLNILYGVQSASFTGLTSETTYYFKIFPFANTGSDIDYKTDGTPPAAEATAEQSNEVDILFTTFNTGWENWTNYSVTGNEVWTIDEIHGIDDTPCAKMSGYNGSSFENEDWLISPAIDLSNFSNENFSFYSAVGYTGPALEVMVSSDYPGTGDPTGYIWEDFTDLAVWPPEGSFFEYTNSGPLDLSAFTDQNIYIAFKFTSTNDESATWELDNIRVIGEGEINPDPEPTNYPTDFAVSAMQQSIMTSWTDATGEVVPQGYLVLLSNMEDIDLPDDGTPVLDDTDLSDGMGAKNVMAGVGMYTFTGLMANTMYYAVIVPYTNSGSLIDYKTDAFPPAGSATTEEAAPEILFTTFDMDWENWTQFSVTGDQIWSRDNSFGLEGSPCALMSGYSDGAYFENEDWLISPVLDFAATSNEMVSFYSATNYDGPALEFKVSTDYDGSGNPNDFTWTDLSDNVTWSSGSFTWTESGIIDISAFTGEMVYLAYTYYSTTDGAANWEIDNVKVQGGTGLPENLLSVNLNLWPNPAKDVLFLQAEETIETVEIFNVAGSMVLSTNIGDTSGNINLNNLEEGIYFARIVTAENQVLSRRIVVQ